MCDPTRDVRLGMLGAPREKLLVLCEHRVDKLVQYVFGRLGQEMRIGIERFVCLAIEPCDVPHKLFAARVYSSGTELPREEWLADHLPVLVSEPVTWQVEYRCFVLERRVVTLSPYWRGVHSAQGLGGWTTDPAEKRAALAGNGQRHPFTRRKPGVVEFDLGAARGKIADHAVLGGLAIVQTGDAAVNHLVARVFAAFDHGPCPRG